MSKEILITDCAYGGMHLHTGTTKPFCLKSSLDTQSACILFDISVAWRFRNIFCMWGKCTFTIITNIYLKKDYEGGLGGLLSAQFHIPFSPCLIAEPCWKEALIIGTSITSWTLYKSIENWWFDHATSKADIDKCLQGHSCCVCASFPRF